jgi:predicted nucleic acid-binding protein
MKNKAHDARRHSFNAADSVLPDANFWLYLYAPQPPSATWAVNAYSDIYKSLITAKTRLFLDVLILSEFANTYARIEWQIGAPAGVPFKQFRKSAAFVPIAQAIATDAKRILKVAAPLDHPFSQWNITNLLDDFGTGCFDCNDQLIIEVCKKHGLTPLTNDSDFTEGGLNVFTANNRLLTACPP